MKDILNEKLRASKEAIRYWWMLVVLGLLVSGLGGVIFAFPAESYLSMAMLFGIAILISGIIHIALAATANNIILGRGWYIVGGIVEIILGIILSLNLITSVVVLPLFLGFWLLFRAFAMLGSGVDMHTLKIAGSGWTIFWGALLLVCAITIIMQPLAFGVESVVIWVGASFLFAGFSMIGYAFQLKTLHKKF